MQPCTAFPYTLINNQNVSMKNESIASRILLLVALLVSGSSKKHCSRPKTHRTKVLLAEPSHSPCPASICCSVCKMKYTPFSLMFYRSQNIFHFHNIYLKRDIHIELAGLVFGWAGEYFLSAASAFHSINCMAVCKRYTYILYMYILYAILHPLPRPATLPGFQRTMAPTKCTHICSTQQHFM